MSLRYKIPLVRQVYRSCERIDDLEESLARYQEELSSTKDVLVECQKELCSTKDVLVEYQQELSGTKDLLAQYQQELANLKDTISTLSARREELISRNEELEKIASELSDIEHALKEGFSQKTDDISSQISHIKSDAYFDELNAKRTIRPTIWGDSSRLHISPKACLISCHFNVNSGEITVGDYTFGGSNVSILAGSHDMLLTGFLRRDAEEIDGCDIHIGKGVWLGSNATILGPVTVGDHAVVAAGAVVAPRTVIEPHSLYGGVPARFIKKIEPILETNDKKNPHIISALERNHGLLCVDGWWEKQEIMIAGCPRRVHKMIDKRAIILASCNNMDIYISCEGDGATNRGKDSRNENVDNEVDSKSISSDADSKSDESIYLTIQTSEEYIDREAIRGSVVTRHICLESNATNRIALPEKVGDSMWVVLESDIETHEIYVLMK